MAAGFKRDIGCRATRSYSGHRQRVNLGVGLTGTLVPTFADNFTLPDQRATHSWIGVGTVQAAPREYQGVCHVPIIIG